MIIHDSNGQPYDADLVPGPEHRAEVALLREALTKAREASANGDCLKAEEICTEAFDAEFARLIETVEALTCDAKFAESQRQLGAALKDNEELQAEVARLRDALDRSEDLRWRESPGWYKETT